jgi:ribose transport system substrate-binding protein
LVIAGAWFGSIFLVGAAATAADRPIIAISFPNSSTIGAVVTEIEAAKKKGNELGYDVIVDDPGKDLNKQINTLNVWIERKVGAIVCDGLEPPVFEAIAKKARDAGVHWVEYGEKIANRDSTVGYSSGDDGKRLGEAAGEWITSTLGGKAKVAILGYEKAEWGRLRGHGIAAGVKEKAPNAEIVAMQDAITPTEGLNTTRTILQAHPDVNVILGVEDPATEGAYKAWVDSGRKKDDPNAFIGGMDGTVPALTLLKEGKSVYRASMAIPLAAVGEAMITVSDKLIKGEHPGDVIVPLELVTPGSPLAEKYLALQGVK